MGSTKKGELMTVAVLSVEIIVKKRNVTACIFLEN